MDLTMIIYSFCFVSILKISSWTIHNAGSCIDKLFDIIKLQFFIFILMDYFICYYPGALNPDLIALRKG
jgi:hypothetical protein